MDRPVKPISIAFSRPIDVKRVGEEGLEMTITANASECARLAELIDLVAVAGLEARFTLRREGLSGIHVRGQLRARVTQSCVVTLDPFDADVVEAIDVHFLPEAEVRALATAASAAAGAEQDGSSGDHDLPDPIIGRAIDLGALTAEFLALGLDPYPRKPGAALPEALLAEAPEEAKISPFAALAGLKVEPPSDP